MTSTFTNSTIEILVILIVAFILGYLFRWILEQYQDQSIIILDSEPEAESAGSGMTVEPITENRQSDDLKIVEGIGPKIEDLLKSNNINDWQTLSESSVESLQSILDEAGDRFRMHNPETWAEQAGLAAEGRWSELEEYQDFLNGGKIR